VVTFDLLFCTPHTLTRKTE